MIEENNKVYQVGDLSPPEARRFLEKLKEEGIPCELEADDFAIRTLSPWQARMGGTFGTGARVLVFVAEEHRLHAQRVHDQLFLPR